MPELRPFIQIARQGSRHHAADAGTHPLHCAGGNQHRQAMGGNGNQRRQHKNGHSHQYHRAAANAIGERAVEKLRDAVGHQQQIEVLMPFHVDEYFV